MVTSTRMAGAQWESNTRHSVRHDPARANDTRSPSLSGVHRYAKSIVTRSTRLCEAHGGIVTRSTSCHCSAKSIVTRGPSLREAQRLTPHNDGPLFYCTVRATFHRPIAQCAAADIGWPCCDRMAVLTSDGHGRLQRFNHACSLNSGSSQD